MINNFPIPVIRAIPPKRLGWSYDRWFQEQLDKHRALKARPFDPARHRPTESSAFDRCHVKTRKAL